MSQVPKISSGRLAVLGSIVPFLYITAGLFAVALLVIHFFFGHSIQSFREATYEYSVRLDDFPQQLEGWRSVGDEELPGGIIDGLGLDNWLLRNYQEGNGSPVTVYMGHIAKEKFERGLGHHMPTTCYPAQGWQIHDQGLEMIGVGGSKQAINRLLVQHGAEKRLVLYWLFKGGQAAAEGSWGWYGEMLAWTFKLPSLVDKKQRTDQGFVRLSMPVTNTPEAARLVLLNFVETAYPEISQLFGAEPVL